MVVQILLDGRVVSTQTIPRLDQGAFPALREAKKYALKAAMADQDILLSQSLRATFRIFDDHGSPTSE